jgi:Family of unknown function (DUF6447)
MAKATKPAQSAETSDIVSDALVQTVVPAGAGEKSPKIVIDDIEYDATNLSPPAKGAIASLQFAEAKLMMLQNELAICQTAHFAYTKGLKAELEGKVS